MTRAIPPHTPRDKDRAEQRTPSVAPAARRPAGKDAGATKPTTPRKCLCCSKTFASQGAHNRLCTTCRGKSVGPYDL